MSTWSEASRDYAEYRDYTEYRDYPLAARERDLFAYWWHRDRRRLAWLASVTAFLAGVLLGGPLWRLLGGG